MVEGPEPTRRVVEDAVQHDAHAAGVRPVQQLAQGGVTAQERVDRQVVVRVVAVVGRRGEDRVEVDRRDAQSLEVVQVVDHAVQVTALEPVVGRRGVPGLEGPGRMDTAAAGEPVREDLVEDGILHPRRGVDRHARGLSWGRAEGRP
jgi:hypothetical protein